MVFILYSNALLEIQGKGIPDIKETGNLGCMVHPLVSRECNQEAPVSGITQEDGSRGNERYIPIPFDKTDTRSNIRKIVLDCCF